MGGRTLEIQRLIGRSLRAVVDLQALGPRTVTLDCDVLQADGGTRTASITGAFVALCLALEDLRRQGVVEASPLRDQVAAVSVGLVGERLLLDLDYEEDSQARVDANFVATGTGRAHRGAAHRRRRPLPRRRTQPDAGAGPTGHPPAGPDPGRGLGPVAAPTLVMATRNPGKIRELQEILQDLGLPSCAWRIFRICRRSRKKAPPLRRTPRPRPRKWPGSPGSRPWPTTPASRWRPSRARPGVFSARYAQDRTAPAPPTDADNWRKLLEEMQGVPWDERGARFVCEIALALPDGRLLTARGECAGVIALEPQGETGFGYDPVFWVPEYGATMAQLGPEIKNRISHRAKALAAFKNASPILAQRARNWRLWQFYDKLG